MIIKEDIDIIQNYLCDASNYKGKASKVYIPDNQLELMDIIKDCYKSKIPFTLSGAGTGLTGGRCPDEGVMISTENINRIIKVDYSKGLARVEPGVLLSSLQKELDANGYFFPPNPTEKNSSIAGNISTNASGSRSFKYGSYRNYIEELKLISASGVEFNIKRTDKLTDIKRISHLLNLENFNNFDFKYLKRLDIKNASGYYIYPGMDLIDLFIGSEGTLAVISEATLRIEKKPEEILGFMVFFDDVENMLKYVDKVRSFSRADFITGSNFSNGISARLIEFFDIHSLNYLSDKYPQIPEKAIACIWTEQEATSRNQNEIIESWLKLIEDYSGLHEETWFAQNEREHERFRDFRHQIPLMIIEKVNKNGFRKIGTDTAVPTGKFYDFFHFILRKFKQVDIENLVYGHIGDCHLHANLLPKTNKEFEKSLDIYNLIVQKAIEFGGTVSAEHGIGKLKKSNLEQMYGYEGINIMREIKREFDPDYLLGRGNMFDL